MSSYIGYKVFRVYNGTDMSQILPKDYKKITIDNFYVVPPADGHKEARVGGIDTNNPLFNVSFERGTFSYDSSTGIFYIGNWTVNGNFDSGKKTMSYTDSYTKVICIYPNV